MKAACVEDLGISAKPSMAIVWKLQLRRGGIVLWILPLLPWKFGGKYMEVLRFHGSDGTFHGSSGSVHGVHGNLRGSFRRTFHHFDGIFYGR